MTEILNREELRQTIADTIDQDVDRVTDDASFTDDLDVDSLMALEVLMVLERKYKVRLKEDRLAEVTSLQAAYDMLSEELNRTASPGTGTPGQPEPDTTGPVDHSA